MGPTVCARAGAIAAATRQNTDALKKINGLIFSMSFFYVPCVLILPWIRCKKTLPRPPQFYFVLATEPKRKRKVTWACHPLRLGRRTQAMAAEKRLRCLQVRGS